MNNIDYTNIIKIINPEDEKWYDKLYQVSFIVGNYSIDYKVYANDTQQALEQVVAYMENSGKTGLFADEAVEKIESDDTKTDGEIRDEIENNYIYVDGTEYGALQPHYIDKINLDIHECLNESNKILESDNSNYRYTYSLETLKNIMTEDEIDKILQQISDNLDDYLNNSGIASINTENKIEWITANGDPDYYGIPTGKVRVNYKDGTSKVFNCIGDYEGVSLYNIIDGVVPSETFKKEEYKKSKKVCENDNEIISKYHTRTNYENKEDKEESIKEDADLVSNSLEALKYKMNDSKSIKVIDSYINSIKEDILKNID